MWRERWNELEARYYELTEKNILTEAEYDELCYIQSQLNEYSQY